MKRHYLRAKLFQAGRAPAPSLSGTGRSDLSTSVAGRTRATTIRPQGLDFGDAEMEGSPTRLGEFLVEARRGGRGPSRQTECKRRGDLCNPQKDSQVHTCLSGSETRPARSYVGLTTQATMPVNRWKVTIAPTRNSRQLKGLLQGIAEGFVGPHETAESQLFWLNMIWSTCPSL